MHRKARTTNKDWIQTLRSERRHFGDPIEEQAFFAALEQVDPESPRHNDLCWEAALRNIGVVTKVARVYHFEGIDLQDLVKEGLIGARKAATRFDRTRGVKFSSYASWWIRAAITLWLRDEGFTGFARIHARATDNLRRLVQLKKEFTKVNGRAPEQRELIPFLMRELEITEDVARELIRLQQCRVAVSSSTPTPDGKRLLEETFTDEVTSSPQMLVSNGEMDRIARDTVHQVDLLQWAFAQQDAAAKRDVIFWRLHAGLGHEEETLASIGKRYSLSRERIRQIVRRESQRLQELTGFSGDTIIEFYDYLDLVAHKNDE